MLRTVGLDITNLPKAQLVTGVPQTMSSSGSILVVKAKPTNIKVAVNHPNRLKIITMCKIMYYLPQFGKLI